MVSNYILNACDLFLWWSSIFRHTQPAISQECFYLCDTGIVSPFLCATEADQSFIQQLP